MSKVHSSPRMRDCFQLVQLTAISSGAGKNENGGIRPAQSAGIFFFLIVPLHFFGSKSTISRFGERFRYSQYSLVSFLFAVRLLTVPACPTESAPMAISLRPTPCILGELLARTQKFVLIYAENFPNDFHSDSSNGGTLRLLCDHLVDPRNLRCAFQSQVVCFQPTHL